MSKLNQFLQIIQLPESLQKITRFYESICMLQSITFHITDTFLVLYLLETHTWAQVSIVFSVQMATQLIFDYPTGILGDWIGQKKILISSFFFLSCANLCILLSESFAIYVLFGVLSGLGNSQFSGILDAWYDSQYTSQCNQIDPDRKIYGLFQGRVYSLYLRIAGLSILVSGLITNNFSRIILFILQIIVYIIMTVPYRLTWLFYSRIIIDLVPNQIRNSIYSFIPTLILLLAIPANLLGGFIIDDYGFVAGILLVVVFAAIGVLFQLYSFKLKKSETSEKQE